MVNAVNIPPPGKLPIDPELARLCDEGSAEKYGGFARVGGLRWCDGNMAKSDRRAQDIKKAFGDWLGVVRGAGEAYQVYKALLSFLKDYEAN